MLVDQKHMTIIRKNQKDDDRSSLQKGIMQIYGSKYGLRLG